MTDRQFTPAQLFLIQEALDARMAFDKHVRACLKAGPCQFDDGEVFPCPDGKGLHGAMLVAEKAMYDACC